jgi:phosphoglycerate dehydrogenase-like enzyme
MIGDSALREQELGGKTLVIVGLGRIGSQRSHAPSILGHRRPVAGGTLPVVR